MAQFSHADGGGMLSRITGPTADGNQIHLFFQGLKRVKPLFKPKAYPAKEAA
jgi:hypothetical protein